jgi:hypothetical protein
MQDLAQQWDGEIEKRLNLSFRKVRVKKCLWCFGRQIMSSVSKNYGYLDLNLLHLVE